MENQPNLMGIITRPGFRSMFYLLDASGNLNTDKIMSIKEPLPIKGTIEDKFGISDFEGIINGSKISFTKKYQEGNATRQAYPGAIVFIGKLTDEHSFGGTYARSDNVKGEFFMTKYHPGSIMDNDVLIFRGQLRKAILSGI